MMPRLVDTAFPAHYVPQTRLSAELRKVWERQGPGFSAELLLLRW